MACGKLLHCNNKLNEISNLHCPGERIHWEEQERMQIDNMLAQSFELLVLGMGTVFSILLLLIVCLTLMSSLMSVPAEVADSAEPVEPDATTSNAAASNATASSNTVVPTSVVAAIQAAIHFYRASPNR
jgi:sodium pump decarboxylase gamma subunit